MTGREDAVSELRARLREIHDLGTTSALLHWDQTTKMPAAAASGRGRQLALLGRLAHERYVAPRMGELLAELSPIADEDTLDGALVRAAAREHTRKARLPVDLVEAMEEHAATTVARWAEARPRGDFGAVAPALERTLELTKRYADCFPEAAHPADPFIDAADPGMTSETVGRLFDALRGPLVALADRVLARPAPDDACLRSAEGAFAEATQLDFGRRVIEALGYDLARGRQDLTHHPFMTRLGHDDVRITTRVRRDHLGEALFSTIHEAGHALYEQGFDAALDATPLANGASMGLHESQSRLWENMVARSRAFWSHFLPALREALPEALADVSLDDFVRAVNRVERSLIRTDADELTYNLHVMLRFDIERALLDGELRVVELPEAWDARMKSDLGCTPPHAGDGVMQDIHWFAGPIAGAFQGYALGNVMAAQIFEAAARDLGDLEGQIGRGEFAPLRGWLRESIHRHGACHLPDETLERATGAPLGVESYLGYLTRKFEGLYGL